MKKYVSIFMAVIITILSFPAEVIYANSTVSMSVYRDIIDDYIAAYEMCVQSYKTGDEDYRQSIFNKYPNVNPLYILNSAGYANSQINSVNKLYYTLKDIDGNGISELIIGTKPDWETYKGYNLYGVYTYENGNVVDLFPMKDDEDYFPGIGERIQIYITASNEIYEESDGGYYYTSFTTYKLLGSQLNTVDNIDEDNGSWYHNSNLTSENEAQKLLNSKRAEIIDLDLKDIYDFQKNELSTKIATFEGLPKTLELEVPGADKEISFNRENVRVEIQDTSVAEVKSGIWADNSDVIITPKEAGTTTIVATSPNGEVLKCTLTVTNNISVVINGKNISLSQKPIIVNGTTLVPIRIFENIGAVVDWDKNSQTATIKKDKRVIKAQIGKSSLNVNGTDIYAGSVPAQNINGSTMVPLRAITESVGGEVNWIEETKTADIYYSDIIDYIIENDAVYTQSKFIDNITPQVDAKTIFRNYQYCYDYMDKYYSDEFYQAFCIAFDDPNMPIKTLTSAMFEFSNMPDYKNVQQIDLNEVYTKNNVADCLSNAIDSITEEDIDLYSINNDVKTVVSKIKSVDGLILGEDNTIESAVIFKNLFSGMSDGIKIINTSSDLVEGALSDYALSETYIEAFEAALDDTGLENDVLKDSIDELKLEYNSWFIKKFEEIVSNKISGKVIGGISKTIGNNGYSFVDFARESLNILSHNAENAKNLKRINAYMIYSLPLSRCYTYYADKIYSGDYTTYDVLQCEKLFDLCKATRVQEYNTVIALDITYRQTSNKNNDTPVRYSDVGMPERKILEDGLKELGKISYKE